MKKPTTSVEPPLRANYYDPDVVSVTRNVLTCLKNGGAACGNS